MTINSGVVDSPRVRLYSSLHGVEENKNPQELETLLTTTRILFMMGQINSRRLWLVVDKELKTICVRQTFAEAYLDLREIAESNV